MGWRGPYGGGERDGESIEAIGVDVCEVGSLRFQRWSPDLVRRGRSVGLSPRSHWWVLMDSAIVTDWQPEFQSIIF